MKFRTLAVALGISTAALLAIPGSGATASLQTGSERVQSGPNKVAIRYLKQKLAWTQCGDPEYRTYCAKVTAPRDWSNQYSGNDIGLAISKVTPGGKSKAKPSRVIFGNPGGPGAAGLGMAPYLASQAGLGKDHLYVGFDPRGTGDSSNVTCEGAPGFTMDARDRDSENLSLISEAALLTRPYCERQSRGLLPYVNTAQTVQDIDLIRQLLGYDKIDWLGYSGGTWLGAYYQTYFPTHVGRFVLDSNTDFTRPWSETFEAQPQAFERRFREDFAPWAASHDDRLHLGSSPRLVIRTYERLRRELKKQPAVEEFLDGSMKLTYDQNSLDQLVSSDMYTKMDFQSLALDLAFLRGLSAAQTAGGPKAAQLKVDALPLARQQELVRRANRGPVGLPPIGQTLADDAESATFTAVTCNDTPWPQGRETGDDLAAELGPTYPLIGWTMNENPCFYWDRPALEMPVPTGKGLPTTLMVQSVHDPATNASLAIEAHQRYAGSRLLTITGEGDHGIYGGVNKCADKIINTFLSTGVAPTRDVSCKGEGIPAPSVPLSDDEERSGAPLNRIAGFTKAVSGYLR
jgi:pimeloyl-ACP methyl ester carboxylesterase